jgi:hypothetical protein
VPEACIARFSLPKVFLFFLVTMLLTAIALLGPHMFGLTPKPGWEVVRWPMAVVGLLAAAIFGKNLLDRRPQLVINGDGILIRYWSNEMIPWTAISGYRIKNSNPSGLVSMWSASLFLKDRLSHPPTGFRAGFGRHFGFRGIAIATVGLDRDGEALLLTMERHCKASGATAV